MWRCVIRPWSFEFDFFERIESDIEYDGDFLIVLQDCCFEKDFGVAWVVDWERLEIIEDIDQLPLSCFIED